MPAESFKRKLAAILSADVKGYSRLMGEDEVATVQTLKDYREAMSKLIREYRGTVVDCPGDNLLAEFASVVDALECSIEIQKQLKSKNASLPDNRKMEFRIGVNLGDVIEEEGRIYGDGVNIAARIEGLADPSGICISRNVYDLVKKRLDLGFHYLGEHMVKNVSEPVQAYRVEVDFGAPLPRVGKGIELSEKPSIAVLPFVNMSTDPERDYFSDGITEEIITGLSRIPQMFVIDRTSTFTYKGQRVKVRQVGQELGVRYVLEGSVRKAADRLRITAQLIDTVTGHHLWADRYDAELNEIFEIQDEITLKISKALEVELTRGEQARIWHRGTKNIEAWGYVVRATHLFTHFTEGDNARAKELFERALEIDPNYAFAWTMLAWTYWSDVRFGWSKSPGESLKRAVELAKKAVSLDETISDVHALLGAIYMVQRQYEDAIAAGQKSVDLGPNSAISHVLFARSMIYAGKFEEAIALVEKGIRLSPYCPAFYFYHLGHAYLMAKRYKQAVETFNELLARSKEDEFNPAATHMCLAESYVGLGFEEQARAHAEEVLKLDPGFSLDVWKTSETYKDPTHIEQRLEALRKAGLK